MLDQTYGGLAHQDAGKISVSSSSVTPEMARAWLAAMPYEHQRNVDKQAVTRLANEMRRANFFAGSTIRIARLADGRELLVDGQHRLNAVAQAGVPIVFTVVREDVPSEAYARELYGKTDRGKARQGRDMVKHYDLGKADGLTVQQANAVWTAAGFIHVGLLNRMAANLPDAERAALVTLYAPHMARLCALAEGALSDVRRALFRPHTLSVALVTLRHNPISRVRRGEVPTVEAFWQGAILGDGLENTDPRKLLHLHLIKGVKVHATTASSSFLRLVTQEYGARAIITLFNRYMSGKKIAAAEGYKNALNIEDPRSEPAIYNCPPASEWTR